jgi:hypothetical protein
VCCLWSAQDLVSKYVGVFEHGMTNEEQEVRRMFCRSRLTCTAELLCSLYRVMRAPMHGSCWNIMTPQPYQRSTCACCALQQEMLLDARWHALSTAHTYNTAGGVLLCAADGAEPCGQR